MYSAQHTIVREQKHPVLFAYLDGNSRLAKQLYNASLYRIRQIFTGWDKESRTKNEQEVFDEVRLAEAAYGITIRRVISYFHLEKLMRATRNPDFFSGLPMQTAQHVVRLAVQNFYAWLAAVKAYKVSSAGFTGKPRMPHYIKPDTAAYIFTNQDAVCRKDDTLKLPGTKVTLPVPYRKDGWKLKQVNVKPVPGAYDVITVFEHEDETIVDSSFTENAAIDFGVENIAAIVYTDGTSGIYKGGELLSHLQLYAKRRGKAVANIAHGKKNVGAHSRRLDRMDLNHENYIRDKLHQISRKIVNDCLEHKVNRLVLGVNKNWKQESNLGRVNNQSFVMMPIGRLRDMITYKAERAGIQVIMQEESYTSQASFVDGDMIPTYGEKVIPKFSGRRIKRGLYRAGSGLVLNADCNAAANILRKALPEEAARIKNFQFLSKPEVMKCSPVKGIAAA